MGKISVAAVFSSHMVLQRNKIVSIFGCAEDGEVVCVQLFDAQKKVICENKGTAGGGKWLVQLAAQGAQTGCAVKIFSEGKNEDCIFFDDVAFGEVWLAGGQSNMEFELQNCTEGPEVLGDETDPNVRFYYTNKIGWKDEHFYEAERNTCWQTWDSEGKKAWSAVGFFFAKKLAADLRCVVGVIGCNWGGTSASAWMRREYIEKDVELKSYIDEYESETAGKSVEQQCKEYDDYEIEAQKWNASFNAMWEKNHNLTWEEAEKVIGKNLWPGPKSCKNPYRPSGLYDCMVSRILPYTIKGVIWYQGESDDHKPGLYYKLFRNMVENWRDDWNDNLPFIIVQLPVHRYKNDRDFKHWCLIREAQEKAQKYISNLWMACALDLGQFNDIHPKGKKVIAERMEMVSLANIYGKVSAEDVMSPLLEGALSAGGKIVLSFSNCENGFLYIEDKTRFEEYRKMEENQNVQVSQDFTGFEVAGRDGKFYPAEFVFGSEEDKLNTITVWSEKVSEPVFARYAWFNYGPVRIYGKNGLPLAPFRTSEEETVSGEEKEFAKVQQIMTV